MDATSIKYTLFVMMIDGWYYNVRIRLMYSMQKEEVLMMTKLLKIPQQETLFLFTSIRSNIFSGHATTCVVYMILYIDRNLLFYLLRNYWNYYNN